MCHLYKLKIKEMPTVEPVG